MKALFLSKNCQLHKLKINFGEEHAQIRKVLPHEGTFHFEVEGKKTTFVRGAFPWVKKRTLLVLKKWAEGFASSLFIFVFKYLIFNCKGHIRGMHMGAWMAIYTVGGTS